MDYIRSNYRTLFPKQLQENELALDSQWYPTTPIAVLCTRIEDYKLFVKAGEDPLNEKNVLRSAYLSIEDTGFFNLPCDICKDKLTSVKNWSNYKLFFTKESANIKYHTTDLVRLNDEAANDNLQPSNTFTAQQK